MFFQNPTWRAWANIRERPERACSPKFGDLRGESKAEPPATMDGRERLLVSALAPETLPVKWHLEHCRSLAAQPEAVDLRVAEMSQPS